MNSNNREKEKIRKILWPILWSVFGAILGVFLGAFLGPCAVQIASVCKRSATYVKYDKGGDALSIYNDLSQLMGKDWYIDSRIDTAFVLKSNNKSHPKVAIATVNGRVIIIDPNKLRRDLVKPDASFDLYVDSVLFEKTNQSRAFDIEVMGLIDWNGDGTSEIFAAANDRHWEIGRVVVLDENLRLLYDYWNPGKFMNAMAVDMDDDGEDELAVYGFNNFHFGDSIFFIPWKNTEHQYYGITYALLDRERSSGQAPAPFQVASKAGKPGVPVWFLTWFGPAMKDGKVGYGFEIENLRLDNRVVPTVRFFQTLGLIINVDGKGNIVDLRPDDVLPTRREFFFSDSFPEPWLLRFREINGRLIQDTIRLKQWVINKGWLEQSSAHQ